MSDIVIYTKRYCSYCVWAKRLLEAKGAEFTEIDVSADAVQFETMMQRSGGRMTAPQIFLGDLHVGGFDELSAMDSRGELDPVLDGLDGGGRVTREDEQPGPMAPGSQENPVADNHRKLIVLGSGCAGLTAAIYAARANLEPLVVTGHEFGGQLYTTTDVENFPGFPEGIQGPELIDRMKAQAERFGAEFVVGHASRLELGEPPFKVGLEDGTDHTADALIVATGASPRELGVPGERELRGYGVSTCATCDAAFFRDREVAVVGGGDSAMEEALFLTKFASKVTIIHRRDEFRASAIMQERALAHARIEVLWDTVVTKFVGSQEKGLQALELDSVVGGERRELAVDGCFVAIGHIPNTEILSGSAVNLNDSGYVQAQPSGRPLPFTGIEGVFVAGDNHDHHYRQAITAAGYGCRAALDAEKWLAAREAMDAHAEPVER